MFVKMEELVRNLNEGKMTREMVVTQLATFPEAEIEDADLDDELIEEALEMRKKIVSGETMTLL